MSLDATERGEAICYRSYIEMDDDESLGSRKYNSGLFLPLFGQDEQGWPLIARQLLYFFGLLWCFVGVAIVADIFLGSIETITSAQKVVKINGREYHVRVWNATVANLTLMALGSSAPEILLSVIEILSNDYYSGELGPSTIVGSAAFNLLVISAICVACIPNAGVRYVKETTVFIITGFFSVFAYLWLVIILQDDVVELWEALVTFLFFPLLVIMSYAADIGAFKRTAWNSSKVDPLAQDKSRVKQIVAAAGGHVDASTVSAILAKVQVDNADKTVEEQTELCVEETMKVVPKSRAYHRVSATRMLTAGKKVEEDENPLSPGGKEGKGKGKGGASVYPGDSSEGAKEGDTDSSYTPLATMEHRESQKDLEKIGQQLESGLLSSACTTKEKEEECVVISLSSVLFAMHLGAPKVTVTVACKGHTTEQAVAYTTQDGTAKAGIDFTAASGKLVFAPGTESLEVDLVGNSSGNPGNFEVILTDTTDDPGGRGGGGCSSEYKDGILAGATVSILPVSDDDHAGVFSFGAASYEVCESEKTTSVAVERTGGLYGDVTVHFTTRDETATGSIDYGVVDEILTFKHGEMVKMVVLDIVDDESYEKEETFQCVLSDPTGGSTLNSQTDGGAEAEITVVHIMSDETQKKFTDSILLLMNVNRDRVKIGHNNWKSQFVAAITVNGGADGVVQPSEWALHLIALPWKLFFAMIPPTDFAGGWVCFSVALIFIGFVTALIGDMAALLGCVVGMKASTTAITFVALGTSLPDTFASMASAKMDRYADNSLGNVTGSNSVNVFLGLGLPWLIAAIYWDNASGETLEAWRGKYSEELPEVVEKFKHGVFVVPAGSLGVSVTTFVVTATVCLLTLGLRRFVVGGELGGPATSKYATSVFFVFMWLAYIVVSVTA